MHVDFNCDAGESFGPYVLGDDANILPLVSSTSLACGFHAGDPVILRNSVGLAQKNNVAIGAHVGYPDRVGFGRRDLKLSPDELYCDTLYQIGAIRAFLRARNLRLHHVKAHGALYNHLAHTQESALAFGNAVLAFSKTLPVLVLAGSPCVAWLQKAGLPVVQEWFADRGYAADGSLLPRHVAGALITAPEEVAARVVKMVTEQKAQSICFHADTPGAANLVRVSRAALLAANIEVRAF